MKRSATLIVVLSLGLCSHGALGQAQSSRITYTTIDVPGALYTSVRGINSAGMMVGDSSTSPIGGGAGFLFKNGHFRHFSYPGGDSTFAYHVNDSGLVVGTVLIGGAAFYGYTYDGTNFQNITIPGYPYTSADGLNNAGVIVGGATGSGNIVLELSGTKSKNITPASRSDIIMWPQKSPSSKS